MLRAALIPIVTMTGIQFGYLLGGAIVVEQIFSVPGLGRQVLLGIQQKEYAVVQSTVLVIATAVRARQPRHRPALPGRRPAGARGMSGARPRQRGERRHDGRRAAQPIRWPRRRPPCGVAAPAAQPQRL